MTVKIIAVKMKLFGIIKITNNKFIT